MDWLLHPVLQSFVVHFVVIVSLWVISEAPGVDTDAGVKKSGLRW